MGTYGVTHVKKDGKIISFTDSYDGYLLDGMGESNVLGIKYVPNELLLKLFDNFNASLKVLEKDLKTTVSDVKEGGFINERKIENAIYLFEKENLGKEANDWFKSCVSGALTTSTCGFAPLMFLNYNPHYGKNYDYCDYLIDLDKETFEYGNVFSLSFEQIKNLPLSVLHNLLDLNLTFVPKEIKGDFESFYDISNEIYTQQKNGNVDNSLLLQRDEIFNYLLNITEDELVEKKNNLESLNKSEIESIVGKEIYNLILNCEKIEEDDSLSLIEKKAEIDKIELEIEKKAESLNVKKEDLPEFLGSIYEYFLSDDDFSRELFEDNDVSGYSVYSKRIKGSTLRKINALVSMLVKIEPKFNFLNSLIEFNLEDHFQEGDISIFSPMDSDKEIQKMFKLFINTLENDFRLSFNTFSSSGSWGVDKKIDLSKGSFSLSGEKIKAPSQSIFSVKELIKENKTISSNDLSLIYHAKLDEIKFLLMKEENKTNALMWSALAIVNKDKDLFDAFYDLSKKELKCYDDETQKIIKDNLLNSVNDFLKINESVKKIMTSLGKEVSIDNSFVQVLKNNNFFNDMMIALTEKEKADFLSVADTGAIRKFKL